MALKSLKNISNALAVAGAPLLPVWAIGLAIHPASRPHWRTRFGLETIQAHPGSIWIHAASVGEVHAASALIQEISGHILLTVDTYAGLQTARDLVHRVGTRLVTGMRPVDHPWTLAPLWAETRPRGVILVEGAFWPHLVAVANKAGIPVARVSARAGRGTRRGTRLFGQLWHDGCACVVTQTEEDASWYRSQGAKNVVFGGDLKAAISPPENLFSYLRPFVVGSSTRKGDEAALISAVMAISKTERPQLLLAPRHLRRLPEVLQLLENYPVRFLRRSALSAKVVPADIDVLLLDTIGELSACYRGASAAFIGGTFSAAIGGHSPADAFNSGVAVVSGPHISANRASFEGKRWETARKLNLLGVALQRAIASPATAWPSTGAAKRTATYIESFVSTQHAPESSPRPWGKPVAAVWARTATLKNYLYDRQFLNAEQVDVPVISIGSTNSRSPGKTTTALWMASLLRHRGHQVGIALRGYRRSAGGSGVHVSWEGNHVETLGDEGKLFADQGFLVAAGPDRVETAKRLAAFGASIIILDDGLQHRRLHRDLDILIVDGRFPAGRGILPAGERRESEVVPARVNAIISHYQPLEAPPESIPVFHAIRKAGAWHCGASPVQGPPKEFVCVVGHGHASAFLSELDVVPVRFKKLPDHQAIDRHLAKELLQWADGLPMVCTAKDWVRLPAALQQDTYWRGVELEVPDFPESLISSF